MKTNTPRAFNSFSLRESFASEIVNGVIEHHNNTGDPEHWQGDCEEIIKILLLSMTAEQVSVFAAHFLKNEGHGFSPIVSDNPEIPKIAKKLAGAYGILRHMRNEVREALPHIDVEDDAYCIGYWAYAAGMPKPDIPEAAHGWNKAKKERISVTPPKR